jgi:phosphoribosyl 1,2-cyclic phosphate phosphodiesterase
LFGLDDSRLFSKWLGGPVPVFCEPDTEETIRRVFSYAFRPGTESWPAGAVPKFQFTKVVPGVEFEVLGQSVLPIRLEHGRFPVLGFRIGTLAYCTDVSRIPEESLPLLQGLDVLILDALRFEPHPTHFSLSEALAVIEALQPGRTFLTHLSHSFDHGPTQAALPPRVALAHDGLIVDF